MAQLDLSVRSGHATATTVKVNVVSLYDGVANGGNDVVIAVGGIGNTAVVLTRFGTDRGSADPGGQTWAGSQGSATVTGLAANTQYTYTATQGARSSTGSFRTALDDSHDGVAFFVGCDKSDGANSIPGYYQFMHTYALTNPVYAMVHHDDHGYVDNGNVDDTGYTGRKCTGNPRTTLLQYDYAVAYMAHLGLLGNPGIARIATGHDLDRQWCFRNINLLPQWGDHEFSNNFSWDAVENPASSPTLFAAAKAVWDKIMLPLQPPCRGSGIALIDTSANHWAADIGCVRIIAIDGITNSSSPALVPPSINGVVSYDTDDVAHVCYGANQVKDIRNGMNVSAPFKILTTWLGSRILGPVHSDPAPPYIGGFQRSGSKQPHYDVARLEWQKLFTETADRTAETPSVAHSVMNNNKTNGILGNTVILHGDEHLGRVVKNYAPAYTGQAAENLYQITMGSINNLNAVPVDQDVSAIGHVFTPASSQPGYSHVNGTTPVATQEFLDTEVQVTTDTTPVSGYDNLFLGCRVEIYGSRLPKEMHIYLNGDADQTLWSHKWVQWLTDNSGAAVNDTVELAGVGNGAQL